MQSTISSENGKHTCPVFTCKKQIPYERAMCYLHWRMTPRALQLRVWQEYRREQGSDAHLRAIDDAAKAVDEQIRAHKDE